MVASRFRGSVAYVAQVEHSSFESVPEMRKSGQIQNPEPDQKSGMMRPNRSSKSEL